MRKNVKNGIIALFIATPLITFAAARNLKELIGEVRTYIELLVPVLIGAAVLFFLFGVFKTFFLKGDDPSSREQGRQFMLWGIIALFVMVSFWGLVNILTETIFGVGDEDVPSQNDCLVNPHVCDEL